MTCNYYYEGKFIGNEWLLADFLLTKHKFLPKFGDLVFLLTDRALQTNDKIQGELFNKGKEADARLKNYVAKHGVEYDSTGRVINLDPPAMGVNKFISNYRHQEGPMKGHRIIPEFIKKEYWMRKMERDWPALNFTEEDMELIKDIEGNPDYDFNQIPTKDTMQKWADKIQERWDAQGKIGTSLHAVAEMFFSKTGNTYNYTELDSNPDALKEWYDRFKIEKDEYGKITYGDFVNFLQFSQMVEMCKKLKTLLENEYGEGLSFYPEFTIATKLALPYQYVDEKTGKTKECEEIMGIIDLLVVDSQGRTHIFDFKTSPKEYRDYSKAKERGFTYQLAVYDRILLHYGIYTGDGSASIIPIKLEGFKYDATTLSYNFDSISYEITKNKTSQVIIKPLPIKGNPKISSDIDEFLPPGVDLEVYSDNLIEKTLKQTSDWFPTYQLKKNMDDALLREMIEKGGGFKPNRNGELVFKFSYNSDKVITISADVTNKEAEMFKKVKKEIESWSRKKQGMVEAFKEDFENAVKNGTRFTFRHANVGKGRQNANYLSDLITPYCDGNYKIINNPAAMCLGMLMLQNIQDDTVTILKLTGAQLDFQHLFVQGRTNINGAFTDDITEDSKGNTRILKAVNGNIEAMEAMLALQNMDYNYNYKIREIKVINPYQQKGMTANNKELLYSFKTLLAHKDVLNTDLNKFDGDSPKIEMLTDALRLQLDFKKICEHSWNGDMLDEFNEKILPDLTILQAMNWDTDIKKELLLALLDDLRQQLELLYKGRLKSVPTTLGELVAPEVLLYNAIMSTMLEIKGFDVRQHIKDADKVLENLNIFRHGWEGLLFENSGNFKSPTLNLLTKIASNVYLKIKDRVNRENATARKLVDNLKKEKNFGWVRSNITGNQTDMYKNMTYVDSTGDFLFVNPDTLAGAEREFLEHALDVINKNRWNEPELTLELWKNSNDPRYYRVPLMAASDGSKMSTNNLLQAAKSKMKTFSPKNAVKEAEEKLAGFFEEDTNTQDNIEKLYEMGSIFDQGESDMRERMLSGENGANRFEHNIERILLHHCCAYELKNQMSKEMPTIKACVLAISMQGAGANLETGNFNNLIDFIENYVKGVIKNQSIVDKRLRKPQALLGKAKKVASFLALAFSPVQFSYQSLEGIWKGCHLIIRKPDGTNAFSFKNMREAFASAYTDLFHYSDTPTKNQLLNEAYGINDMDSTQYADRISSDHGIWTHFTDFAFRFASRPDFYNRMTIWGALMRNDGTWDAHEVVDGLLVYRFDKDKRYAALKTAPKGSPEYNEAFSRYLAALEQFKAEGVTNPDGSELKVGDDLPRAYSNQEAQGMKAVADNMYGYYNHENRSMFNSMLLGGLVSQMKTYWSAKKNQYFAPGGVKLMGKWEDYKENGVQLYYAVDERGEIDLSKPWVKEGEPNCSGVKVQRWKGQWQEGVFVTLVRFWDKYRSSSLREAWNDMVHNPDVNLRTAYRSNLKHLALDIFFMALFGNACLALIEPWDEETKKAFYQDQGDMLKAAEYATASLFTNTVERSFLDFNFFSSIFSPTIDWLPFSLSSLDRLVKNSWEYLTTDKSFASTMANSSAMLRQSKPILKCIAYNED